MRISLKFTYLLPVSLLVISTGLAQDSGIQGVVTDASQAVVPGAEVTVTYPATALLHGSGRRWNSPFPKR